MPMIDLAYTEDEMKEMAEDKCCPMPDGYKGPKYPWSLEMSFEDGTLEKLGKTAKDFTLGEEMIVPVRLKVTRLMMREDEEGKSENVGFVATGVDLGSGGKSEEERADKMYGKGE